MGSFLLPPVQEKQRGKWEPFSQSGHPPADRRSGPALRLLYHLLSRKYNRSGPAQTNKQHNPAWGKGGRWLKKVLPWLAGLLTGFLGGLLGGGGGLVAVPLLRVCGLEGKEVHATSLAVTLSLSCLSAWLYLRAGRLDLMSAAPYLPGGLAGALAGALLLRKANPRLLRLLFAGLLLVSGGRLLLG